ncbi:MAG: ATP-binding protein [Eubacterium sp.]|nr:ATP-binding protein [Eubacterium sp.]
MRQIVIDPRVIKHLGRDLITSSEVAVIELVKNSIDAKAKTINLRVCNNFLPIEVNDNLLAENIPHDYFRMPFLIVEDDGLGMTDRVIDDGFLKIATNIKSNESSSLGEKGIGRLATQRLGSALLVETSSPKENHTSYVFINWEDVIKGAKEVPSFEAPSTSHHTRLWIFGINLEDYIDNAIQFQQLPLDGIGGVENQIQINRDLKSALNFLISPFITDNTNSPRINFYFDNNKVDIAFPHDTLELAESVHHFRFQRNEEKLLNYGLSIKPWFIERVHRALVKAEAFKRLKKSHQYYEELLIKNSGRIGNVLESTLSTNELTDYFYQILSDFYATNESPRKKEVFEDFIRQKANETIKELTKIAPVNGSIYSFKQGAAIGDKIIIDSAFELNHTDHRYSLSDLKYFLENYNGVKLYRGVYRIGFLGDKESDWIKLQQFRTKGQQWYRFDLGNTVGYVSLSDDSQDNIQEISSRLDISENRTSEAFKLLINVVFNYLFYELNRKANDIIKVLLAEEGLLGENLAKRVKKNDADLQEMIRRNKRMQKALQDVAQHLDQGKRIDGTDQVSLPEKSYSFLSDTLKKLDSDIKADSTVQEKTAVLLSEADAQLKAIEVESYNNYKLMANGLITETITHELHSLSKTGISPKTDEHFAYLKDYFVNSGDVPAYNHHVVPIQNSYTNISGKLDQVGDLYSFLETTFIKKGTFDEFIYQSVFSVVSGIAENLKENVKKEKIFINCKTGDLTWFVPKGVLLHVFYNLINNSLYWIDVRRKRAQSDPYYSFSGVDEITIEEHGIDGIIIYDTGTGVSKSMEDILFEPLQSGKPFSEGRGMGLYIVRKLLNSFGGEIELLEDRNQYGNRFKFLIVSNTSEDL